MTPPGLTPQHLPRLVGPRVALVPAPHDVAVAALAGPGAVVEAALAPLGLRAATGWPHADTADALRPLAEHGAAGDGGAWLICVDRGVVGECGWRSGPDAEGAVELSYGLATASRRQGLGTEAVAVLVAWSERQPGVRRLVAEVLVGNEPSRRLLRRLGFVEAGGTPPYVTCVRDAGLPQGRIAGRHVC